MLLHVVGNYLAECEATHLYFDLIEETVVRG